MPLVSFIKMKRNSSMRLYIFLLSLPFFLSGYSIANGTERIKIKNSSSATVAQQIALIKRTATNWKSASCTQIDQAMAYSYGIGYILKSDKKNKTKNTQFVKTMSSYYAVFQKVYKNKCRSTAPITKRAKITYPKIVQELAKKKKQQTK